MEDVSEKTKSHLTRVYTTLMMAAASCVIGMTINQTIMLTGILVTIGMIAAIAFFIYQI
jgi:FtsH-binding integral membrane protein